MSRAPGPSLSEVLKPEVLAPLLQDPEVSQGMMSGALQGMCGIDSMTVYELQRALGLWVAGGYTLLAVQRVSKLLGGRWTKQHVR